MSVQTPLESQDWMTTVSPAHIITSYQGDWLAYNVAAWINYISKTGISLHATGRVFIIGSDRDC